MIFTLSTFINLCLIFAVWKLRLDFKREIEYLDEYCARNAEQTRSYFEHNQVRMVRAHNGRRGVDNQALLKATIAEKFAERAFNLASTANLGIIALQKSLQTRPRVLTREQGVRNELAKNSVDSLFTGSGNFDWLRPVLSDEENDLLDQVESHNSKHGNGKVTN